ncbi:hypothetical protein [Frigoribacterium sp. Leaf263]|uniref:hypothetical protein n=1 Tax=Frigoribacterium sp. Leaf263 TaxID=1736313 RepID=UPI000A5A1285|nr:hypothetical protein [Frigoribacterium sp. Leaf263]
MELHMRKNGDMGVQGMWGRDQVVETILDTPPGVVILAGDSGVGKSHVLRGLGSVAPSSTLLSEIHDVSGVDDSLRSAIAKGLGDCVRSHQESHPGDLQIWGRLDDLVKSAGSASAKKAGALIVDAAFGALASKVGKETADIIRSGLQNVLTAAENTFETRLGEFISSDVAAELSKIAKEIASWSESHLVIRLDHGERLSANDTALLTTLAESEEATFALVVALSDADIQGRDTLALLRTRGVSTLRLEPLKQTDIDQWCESQGIIPAHWDALGRVTSGYPLFILAALSLEKEGLPLSELAPEMAFSALLENSWNQVPEQQRLQASKLAVFRDAPPDEFLTSYLNTDAMGLGALRRVLVRTGIFVAATDTTWFHDRRRVDIWDRILESSERMEVSAAAFDKVKSWLEEADWIESWTYTALPTLIRSIRADALAPYLLALTNIKDDEAAIMWALLELGEPDGTLGQFSDTAAVVRWAGHRHSPLENPIDALQRLLSANMTVSAADEQFSMTGAVIPDIVSHAALIGEIEKRFAAQPIQNIASEAFNAYVRPLVPKFHQASIATGVRDLRGHKAALEKLRRTDNQIQLISSMIALGFTLKIQAMSVSITMTFKTHADQQVAVDALRKFPISARITFDDPLLLPPQRVAWRGVVDILEGAEPIKSISLHNADHLLEIATARMAAEKCLRHILPSQAASALGLEHPRRYLIQVDDELSNSLIFEVIGGQEKDAVQLSQSDWPGLMHDPLRELRLRAAGYLGPDERIGLITGRFSRDKAIEGPLSQLAGDLKRRGREYNRYLPKIEVSPNVEIFKPRIKTALIARKQLQTALNEIGLLPSVPTNESYFVDVFWSPDALRGHYLAQTVVVDDGAGTVRVRNLKEDHRRLSWPPSPAELAHLGLAGSKEIQSSSSGDYLWQLADLLGFDHEDLVPARSTYLGTSGT